MLALGILRAILLLDETNLRFDSDKIIFMWSPKENEKLRGFIMALYQRQKRNTHHTHTRLFQHQYFHNNCFFFLGLSFKDGSVLFPRGFLVTSQTQKDSKHEIPSLQEIL